MTDICIDKFYSSLYTKFNETSEYLNLLPKTLEVLGWDGSSRKFIDSLPYASNRLDLSCFRTILARLNYKTIPIKSEFNSIDSRMTPFLFISNDKVLLIISIDAGKVIAIDGIDGKTKQIESSSIGSGVFYIFKKLDNVQYKAKNWFLSKAFRFKSLIKQIILTSILTNLFLLSLPLFILTTYDMIIPAGSFNMLLNFSFGTVILLVSSMVITSTRTKMIAYINSRLDKTISDCIFSKLLYLPPQLTENASASSQISKLNDFKSIKDFFTTPLANICFDLPFICISFFLIWYIGGTLVYIPLIMVIVYSIMFFTFSQILKPVMFRNSQFNTNKTNILNETIEKLSTIKSCISKELWLNRYKDICASSSLSEYKISVMNSIVSHLSDTIMMITGVAIIGYGAYQVLDDSLSVGALIGLMIIVWKSLNPIKSIFSITLQTDQLKQSVLQLNKLMSLPSEHDVEGKSIDIEYGSIAFKKVSFKYSSQSHPTLYSINFNIKPNQLVCLAGKNGSGKSTILKLVCKIYIPQVGTILLDGFNPLQLDTINLRQSIGYLSQECKIFYGTIAENILMANPLASNQQLINAARASGLDYEMANYPNKYNTIISQENYKMFSSNFIQALSLARVFIKNSKLYLLDEPTSYLDKNKKQNLIQSILKLKQTSTLLVATHDIEILQMADRILCLDEGQIVADDKPSTILKSNFFKNK